MKKLTGKLSKGMAYLPHGSILRDYILSEVRRALDKSTEVEFDTAVTADLEGPVMQTLMLEIHGFHPEPTTNDEKGAE